jgi:hypothetical protein
VDRVVVRGVAIAIGAAIWLLFRPMVRGIPPVPVVVANGAL